MIIEFLKKIKKLEIYFYILKFIFIPIYNFIWIYILNLKDKLVGIIFNLYKINSNFTSLENNTKKVIKNNQYFKEISKEIKNPITSDLIEYYTKKIENNNLEYKDNEAQKKNPFLVNLFPFLEKDVKKKIINFAASDYMLKTAYRYLGVFPILSRIYLNLNIPTGKEQSSSQLWHRDDFGYKNLDLFMAINDIDENNGPLYCIKKKDPLNIFFRIKNEINSGLKGERGKITDKNFNYLGSEKNENLSVLKGVAGTAMLIDSIRNYHKGGYCKTNYRLTLRINYMTNDSTYPIQDLDSERLEWLSLLENDGYFNKYSLRKRSVFFEKFRIPEKLFNFYHAISIKK